MKRHRGITIRRSTRKFEKFEGVFRVKGGKWVVRVKVEEGGYLTVGQYDSQEKAEEVYQQKQSETTTIK